MGWWRRRTQQETLEHLNRHVCAARICLMSGNLEFIDGKEVSRNLLCDLPSRIEGRGNLAKSPIVEMLEDGIPGILDALYEWFEPRSRGELIGEVLSSYPYEAAQKSSEDP